MNETARMVMTKAGLAKAFGVLSALALTIGTVGASSLQDTSQTSRSPCDVLTKKEVEEVLNAKVGDPIRRGDACHFEPASRPARGIIVTVYWTGGESRMEATRMAERMFRSAGTLDKEFGQNKDDVKELGDEASFPLKTLNVLKGDAFLKIEADLVTRKQAIALAQKALARM